MADLPVSDFSRRCIDELPGIPPPQVDRLVREIARDLCRAGRLWRLVLPTITVSAEISQYELLGIPDCAALHDIDVVLLNEVPVVGESASLNQRTSDSVYWTRSGGSIRIANMCSGGSLAVQAVLIPRIDACDLPGILMEEWIEVVEDGVKAKAMLQSKKEWSNPELGKDREAKWMIGLAKARGYGRNGNTTARRRTVDPWARRQTGGF